MSKTPDSSHLSKIASYLSSTDPRGLDFDGDEQSGTIMLELHDIFKNLTDN